jgi:hypothetical protein
VGRPSGGGPADPSRVAARPAVALAWSRNRPGTLPVRPITIGFSYHPPICRGRRRGAIRARVAPSRRRAGVAASFGRFAAKRAAALRGSLRIRPHRSDRAARGRYIRRRLAQAFGVSNVTTSGNSWFRKRGVGLRLAAPRLGQARIAPRSTDARRNERVALASPTPMCGCIALSWPLPSPALEPQTRPPTAAWARSPAGKPGPPIGTSASRGPAVGVA